MSNTRQKIILTYSNTSLADKIAPDTEHCHILLDSAGGAFTVTLPDAQATMQRELIFKNIGTNNVTIQAKSGQYIDLLTSHVIAPLDLVSVWSDLVRTWWLLDSNSNRVSRVTSSPYTVLISDQVLFFDTDGGAMVALLPAGAASNPAGYKIINCGSSGYDVTITPNGTERLLGVAATDILRDDEVVDLVYDSVEGWR